MSKRKFWRRFVMYRKVWQLLVGTAMILMILLGGFKWWVDLLIVLAASLLMALPFYEWQTTSKEAKKLSSNKLTAISNAIHGPQESTGPHRKAKPGSGSLSIVSNAIHGPEDSAPLSFTPRLKRR